MEAGAIKQACARFEESQRLAPDLLTSLGLAECEIAAGDIEQGCAHLLVVERQSHAAGHSERAYRIVQERVRAHALDCE
jgi:hypothetical protein